MTDSALPPAGDSDPQTVPTPAFDPDIFPHRHRPIRQWVLDHNPVLLLSTVVMLLGCYLMNAALRERSSDIHLLPLLGAINLYEACIIPLGLVLIRRTRGTARDGWWLLLFETLFLVNATFINPDFSAGWAIPLNIALFMLACVKAAVILYHLQIGLSWRTFGFFALQLAIIYFLPILFNLTKQDGVLSQRIMYGCWWLVGMLPVMYDVLARNILASHRQWNLVQNVIRRVYLIAPWLMLVAQLGFSHWAHRSDFSPADLSPVLLGLAVAMRRPVVPFPLRSAGLSLCIFAFFLSFGNGQISWSLAFGGQFQIILPAHLTAAASILTYCYLLSPLHFLAGLASICMAALGYVFQAALLNAIRRTWDLMTDLIPTTLYAWGLTAIMAAFMLLGAGSFISLKRTKPVSPDPYSGP